MVLPLIFSQLKIPVSPISLCMSSWSLSGTGWVHQVCQGWCQWVEWLPGRWCLSLPSLPEMIVSLCLAGHLPWSLLGRRQSITFRYMTFPRFLLLSVMTWSDLRGSVIEPNVESSQEIIRSLVNSLLSGQRNRTICFTRICCLVADSNPTGSVSLLQVESMVPPGLAHCVCLHQGDRKNKVCSLIIGLWWSCSSIEMGALITALYVVIVLFHSWTPLLCPGLQEPGVQSGR